MRPDSPLTDAHLQAIDRVLDRCVRIRGLLENCRKCDLDIEEPLRQIEEQLQRAEKLKATFYPDVV